MKTLVTGSAGLIGSHVCRALAAAGHEVRGLDVVTDGTDARDFFRKTTGRFAAVVHCAATVAGVDKRGSIVHAQNLETDAAMFQWAARARPGRVVYFSSSCAYPAALGQAGKALREDDIDLRAPRWPDGLYGWVKLTGELLAATVAAGGVPVTVVRPFSVYGPGMREGFAVRSFAEQARARADPVEVWGDALQVRDFIHAADVAAAVAVILQRGIGGPVNLGTGEGTSLAELAALAGRAAGYSPQVKVNEAKPAGVSRLVADASRLHSFYRPRTRLGDYLAGVLG